MGNREGRHWKLKTLVKEKEVEKLLKVSCASAMALTSVPGKFSVRMVCVLLCP